MVPLHVKWAGHLTPGSRGGTVGGTDDTRAAELALRAKTIRPPFAPHDRTGPITVLARPSLPGVTSQISK